MSDRLKHMKETLMSAIESQMYNLNEVDTEELGDVIDMIKDLEEATYYCAVVKAMEESEEKQKNGEMMYYPPMYFNSGYGMNNRMMNDGGMQTGMGSYYMERSGNTDGRDMPRSYYNGGSSGGGNNSSSGGSGGNSGGRGGSSSQFTEKEFPYAFADEREGRSPRARRMYMESKETHQDKASQMRELEKYMQELSHDVVEMIEGASPEERQYLSKKISALATKLTQTNG